MTKLEELYKQKEELKQKQATLEEWMDHFDDIKLYALADQMEDEIDLVINSLYVVQTQINKLEEVK